MSTEIIEDGYDTIRATHADDSWNGAGLSVEISRSSVHANYRDVAVYFGLIRDDSAVESATVSFEDAIALRDHLTKLIDAHIELNKEPELSVAEWFAKFGSGTIIKFYDLVPLVLDYNGEIRNIAHGGAVSPATPEKVYPESKVTVLFNGNTMKYLGQAEDE